MRIYAVAHPWDVHVKLHASRGAERDQRGHCSFIDHTNPKVDAWPDATKYIFCAPCRQVELDITFPNLAVITFLNLVSYIAMCTDSITEILYQ